MSARSRPLAHVRNHRRPTLCRSRYFQPRPRLHLEILEDRVLPATFTWTGANASVDTKWSDGANWAGGAAPSAGADLVFPQLQNPLSLTSTNDFPMAPPSTR